MEERNVIIHKEFPPAAYTVYHFQSVLLTKKEQAQGMDTVFNLLTIPNLPNTRYLFLLYNGLVMKQATKSIHLIYFRTSNDSIVVTTKDHQKELVGTMSWKIHQNRYIHLPYLHGHTNLIKTEIYIGQAERIKMSLTPAFAKKECPKPFAESKDN